MKCTIQSLIVGLLVVTMLFGCAGKEQSNAAKAAAKANVTTDAAAKTQVDKEAATDDATRTKAEGTALGIAGGMAASAVLKAVLPGSKKIKKAVQYGSGIVGGVGGHLLGSSIAQRKKKYANEEDRLNGEIELFSKLNGKLSAYNDSIINDIAYLNKQISELNAKNKTAREQAFFSEKEKASYVKKIEQDKATTAKLATELSDLNEYYQSVQATGNPSRVAALRKEIEILQRHTTQFDSNNKQMDKLVASMPVRN